MESIQRFQLNAVATFLGDHGPHITRFTVLAAMQQRAFRRTSVLRYVYSGDAAQARAGVKVSSEARRIPHSTGSHAASIDATLLLPGLDIHHHCVPTTHRFAIVDQ